MDRAYGKLLGGATANVIGAIIGGKAVGAGASVGAGTVTTLGPIEPDIVPQAEVPVSPEAAQLTMAHRLGIVFQLVGSAPAATTAPESTLNAPFITSASKPSTSILIRRISLAEIA